MLILSRKPGESIVIDGRITVKIIRIDGDAVKVGIEAPSTVPVHRQEVYAEIQKNNQEAMTHTEAKLPRLVAPLASVPNSKNKSDLADSPASPAPVVPKLTKPTPRK
ncbi:MAG TPA: carbon storage regulator CsrA [Candidatus Baltobacteraceae bacterium]|jgi:carbon storage regulator|nr:carbon storage regulator CsrA [Candidatus Baltobacteraceae bacterium]